MSQVSQRFLRPDVKAKIERLLIECIARCSSQQAAANFVDVLLTSTEKLMIAKRIAIALMLVKGYGAGEIDAKLKVSVATIYSVKAWLEAKGGEYRSLLEEIAQEDRGQAQEREQLVNEAQSFFSLRPGTNWKQQRREQWQKVKDKKIPF